MRIFKRANPDPRPSLAPARPDREAMLRRAEFIQRRYHAPPMEAEKSVMTMDIPGQTLLAIEMAEHEREAFTFDYDPFGAL
jgi:hypothetical protein